MKTTKKACLVFSLLCLGVFSGCENEVETGRHIQYGGNGSVSETTHYENPANGNTGSRTKNYDNGGDFQDAEIGRWIWRLAKDLLSGPSN
jgi:hypothetical protein